jgi:hypothetical protein
LSFVTYIYSFKYVSITHFNILCKNTCISNSHDKRSRILGREGGRKEEGEGREETETLIS